MDQKVRSNSLFKLPQDCSSCWTERDVGQCGSEWNIARTYCSAKVRRKGRIRRKGSALREKERCAAQVHKAQGGGRVANEDISKRTAAHSRASPSCDNWFSPNNHGLITMLDELSHRPEFD